MFGNKNKIILSLEWEIQLLKKKCEVVSILREELATTRLVIKELLDRIMSKDLTEFVSSQVTPDELDVRKEPNYDAFIGTVGDIKDGQ